ncbi:MAG: DUF4065 domain-containing protein [Sphaerochaeta sp.]|nr:DUF4065 domain-containing protein [Sphaerochaeta sp.]
MDRCVLCCPKKLVWRYWFYAWPLGPVIPSIKCEFRAYGSVPFLPYGKRGSEILPISKEETELLDTLIPHYASMSACNLVEKSHKGGSSWATKYRDGLGKTFAIPFDLIQHLCK